MSEKTQKMFLLVDSLPEKEQNLINEIIKDVILAWDPDFTKLTPTEEKRVCMAEQEIANGEYYSADDVWKELGL